MASLIRKTLIILALVTLASSCFSSPPKEQEHIYQDSFRILVLGDFVADKQSPKNNKRWTDYLQDYFDQNQVKGKDIVILNRSLAGLNTYGLLQRLDRFIERDRPHLVLIQIGHNNFFNRTGLGTFLFPYLPNPKLNSLHLSEKTRDPFELSNPLNAKFKDALNLCKNPNDINQKDKQKTEELLLFLESQQELSSEALSCLGTLQFYVNNNVEDALENQIQSLKKQNNIDLTAGEFLTLKKICYSTELSFRQKLKLLWNVNLISFLIWEHPFVESKLRLKNIINLWLSDDLSTIVKKIKKKKTPVVMISYPFTERAHYFSPNRMIQKIAIQENAGLVVLPETLGFESDEALKKISRIIYNEISQIKEIKNVD